MRRGFPIQQLNAVKELKQIFRSSFPRDSQLDSWIEKYIVGLYTESRLDKSLPGKHRVEYKLHAMRAQARKICDNAAENNLFLLSEVEERDQEIVEVSAFMIKPDWR